MVDAIDTVSTKLALAALAQERGFELISSMGGAKKIHPECLRIADVHKTVNRSLARIMRKECRKRGIRHLRVPLLLRRAGAHRRRPGCSALGAHRLGHRELHAAHHGPDDRGRGPAPHLRLGEGDDVAPPRSTQYDAARKGNWRASGAGAHHDGRNRN
ncbi:MAG: hypothetical protein ACLTSX_02295 [Collinsella sp.]